MKVLIDIKTPAGKSFDGFPKELLLDDYSMLEFESDASLVVSIETGNDGTFTLHPGDTITIQIKE